MELTVQACISLCRAVVSAIPHACEKRTIRNKNLVQRIAFGQTRRHVVVVVPRNGVVRRIYPTPLCATALLSPDWMSSEGACDSGTNRAEKMRYRAKTTLLLLSRLNSFGGLLKPAEGRAYFHNTREAMNRIIRMGDEKDQ